MDKQSILNHIKALELKHQEHDETLRLVLARPKPQEWLAKHIKVPADKIVFEHDKYKYAVQPDGTPNILIDDYGVNTRAWDAAGGIAVKYQADEDTLDKVVQVLAKVFGKDK